MKKIFVLEDEKILFNVLLQKLRKAGFVAVGSEDGADGVRRIKDEKPDLLLLDIMLPGKGGFEVLEELRKDEATKNLPVIIISNSGQPVEIERGIKLGVRDYLIKAEFDPAEVIEKIEKVLGKGAGEMPVTNSAVRKEEMHHGAPGVSVGRVLVVEDDKFLRDLIVKKLRNEGFKVYEAIDGEEGLRIIIKESAEIILLDLILPGIDGFEVLRRLKEQMATKNIPVIVLSNLGQAEDIARASSLGANSYMIKAKFTPDEIISNIKKILKEHYI